MARVNIYRYDEIEGRSLDGWFDPQNSTEYAEATEWDGNNRISVATGSQCNHEVLYRTPGGRWVLHTWSQWEGTLPGYQFITDAKAHEWLLINGHDDAVREHWGEIEEERGPGRPEIGKPINVRLGDELLARVNAEAARRGQSRADTLRGLVEQALA